MQTILTQDALRVKLARHSGQLQEIARLSGVSYSIIYKIANGSYKSSPSMKTAERLWHAADAIAPPAKKTPMKSRARA